MRIYNYVSKSIRCERTAIPEIFQKVHKYLMHFKLHNEQIDYLFKYVWLRTVLLGQNTKQTRPHTTASMRLHDQMQLLHYTRPVGYEVLKYAFPQGRNANGAVAGQAWKGALSPFPSL